MKKLFLIGTGFVLAVVIFGVAGFAYAQTLRSFSVQFPEPPESQTADNSEFPFGRSDWSRGSRGGMMGGRMSADPGEMMGFGLGEVEPGPLHDYLWPAVAEAFSLTTEQIEAFEIVRETKQGIWEDLTQEEIRDTMKQTMTAAIENALADGAITEEQAERWLERLEIMDGLAPRMPFEGRGRAGNYRQGFANGMKVGRQMMINHEYLDAAISDALDITVDELQEMKTEQGFNLKAYTEEQGLNEEEFAALHLEIFANAVNAALEDGAITQEQADWILERVENFEGRGVWFNQP